MGTATEITSLASTPEWAGGEYAQLAMSFVRAYSVEVTKQTSQDAQENANASRAWGLVRVAFADFLARRRG